MEKEIVTVKIFMESRKDLRLIAAQTGETQQEVVARLLTEEKKRLEKNDSADAD